MNDVNCENHIRQLGIRITPQRQLILKAVAEAGEHATFERIYARVHAQSSAISRATVYRTIDLFSRHSIIHENIINRQKVYELASKEHHHHIICRRCWSNQKITHQALQDFIDHLDEEYDFLIQPKHLFLIGLCAHCRTEEEKDPHQRPEQ